MTPIDPARAEPRPHTRETARIHRILRRESRVTTLVAAAPPRDHERAAVLAGAANGLLPGGKPGAPAPSGR